MNLKSCGSAGGSGFESRVEDRCGVEGRKGKLN